MAEGEFTPSGQPWNAYHDFLIQEAIGLMTEPNWYEQSDITTRLENIRTELQSAGATTGVPMLNEDGTIKKDAQGNTIYEPQDERLSKLLKQFEDAYGAGVKANKDRYEQLVGSPDEGGSQERIMDYQERYEYFTGDDSPFKTASDKFGTVKTGFDTDAAEGQTAMDAAKTAADSLKSTYESSMLGTKDAQGNYTGGLAGQDGAYGTRSSSIMDLYGYGENALGTVAKKDLQDQYSALGSQARQDLISRGLGNSTVLNTVLGNIGTQESNAMNRLNEQLRRERIGSLTQLSGEELAARERGIQGTAQLGLEPVKAQQAAGQYAGQIAGTSAQLGSLQAQQLAQNALMAQQLSADPLGAIERRTDVTPSLADISNLTMQLGRGASNTTLLPAMGALTSYGQSTSQQQQPTYGFFG